MFIITCNLLRLYKFLYLEYALCSIYNKIHLLIFIYAFNVIFAFFHGALKLFVLLKVLVYKLDNSNSFLMGNLSTNWTNE